MQLVGLMAALLVADWVVGRADGLAIRSAVGILMDVK
jgi:hypothetical protein